MFYQLYLFIGLILAVFTFGMLWKRVSIGKQRLRLILVCAAILVAWPGVGLLAWFDKDLTVRDYINSWLFPVLEEESDSEEVTEEVTDSSSDASQVE